MRRFVAILAPLLAGCEAILGIPDPTLAADASVAASNWTLRQRYPFLLDVAFGNGVFVATGRDTVYYSTDGATWTEAATVQQQGTEGITFGGGVFVLGGDLFFQWSADGRTWNRVDAPRPYWDIGYLGGQFIAVGSESWSARSTDGRSWVESRAVVSTLPLTDIAVGGGRAVATSTQTGRVMFTSDGISWTARTPSGATQFWGVEYVNGQFIALGPRWYSSPDGDTWTEITTLPPGYNFFDAMAYFSNQYVVFGHEIYTSPDLTNWTLVNLPWSISPYGAAITSPTRLVAVGQRIAFSNDGTVWGFPWGRQSANTFAFGAAAPAGNDAALVVGGWALMSSDDGATWTVREEVGVGDVIYDGTRYVTVSGNTIFRSDDGAVWMQSNLPVGYSASELAYGAGTFVAGGAGGWMFSSPDAVTWTEQAVPTLGDVTDVIYAGGRFVATGNAGTATSNNGVIWTSPVAVPGDHLAYIGGLYIMVQPGGQMRTSNDAVTWNPTVGLPQVLSLDFDATEVIALSRSLNVERVFRSTDGLNWTALPDFPTTLGFDFRPQAVRLGQRSPGPEIVVLGEEGVILTRP